MSLPITALYLGLNILLLIGLMGRVIVLRRRFTIGIGHGEERSLHRAIRVHSNLSENLPVAMLALAILELSQQPVWIVHGLGIGFLVARCLHAMGMSKKSGVSVGRFYGTALTITIHIVAAGALLRYFISSLG